MIWERLEVVHDRKGTLLTEDGGGGGGRNVKQHDLNFAPSEIIMLHVVILCTICIIIVKNKCIIVLKIMIKKFSQSINFA
jgi:hypothetical protein